MLVGILSGIVLFEACSPDFLESDPVNAPMNEGVLSLDYEAEIITWQEVGDATEASFIDKIHGMAHAMRSKVQAEIYDDGSSAWRIEKLEPHHNVKVPDQTPPDPTPQTKVTRIDRNGKGYFYSSTGTLLNKHDVPVQSFTGLLERFKKSRNPDIAYSIVGVQSQQQVSQVITTARANGAEVYDLGNGNVSIRSAVPQTAFKNGRGSTTNFKGVDIYNEKVGILVGSRLYDEANMLLSETFYAYRKANNKNKIEPEVIYQKTFNKDPKTGEIKTTFTNTYFASISAKTKK